MDFAYTNTFIKTLRGCILIYMNKLLMFILICVAGVALVAQTAFALLPMPFGGEIQSSSMSGVTCPGTGPATILPYNTAASTPYYIAPGIPSGYGLFPQGAYVLGLYYPVMFPICYAGEVPFPVFPVIMYGVSSPTI